MTYVNRLNQEAVDLFSDIRIGEGCQVISSEISGKVALERFSTISKCVISGYIGMGCFSFLSRAVCASYITIGSRASIGAFCHPTDWFSVMEFQYRSCLHTYGEEIIEADRAAVPESKTTFIGGDVWIGDNVFVKAGVRIKNGSIIGGGSVLTKDTEPYVIYGGNPARPIRARFSSGLVDRYQSSEWWKYLDIRHLRGIDFSHPERAISQIEGILSSLPANGLT